MEVEGIHVPSEDTEQGNRVHRRVHKPSLEKANPEKASPEKADYEERPDGSEVPDPTRTVRGLTLTSTALQLTATMDLVEVDGTTAVPVEYRKGRPRRVHDDDTDSDGNGDEKFEPWPTDRVQAALQAILLTEAGYEVPEIA